MVNSEFPVANLEPTRSLSRGPQDKALPVAVAQVDRCRIHRSLKTLLSDVDGLLVSIWILRDQE